jgi:hypothetical protein
MGPRQVVLPGKSGRGPSRRKSRSTTPTRRRTTSARSTRTSGDAREGAGHRRRPDRHAPTTCTRSSRSSQ